MEVGLHCNRMSTRQKNILSVVNPLTKEPVDLGMDSEMEKSKLRASSSSSDKQGTKNNVQAARTTTGSTTFGFENFGFTASPGMPPCASRANTVAAMNVSSGMVGGGIDWLFQENGWKEDTVSIGTVGDTSNLASPLIDSSHDVSDEKQANKVYSSALMHFLRKSSPSKELKPSFADSCPEVVIAKVPHGIVATKTTSFKTINAKLGPPPRRTEANPGFPRSAQEKFQSNFSMVCEEVDSIPEEWRQPPEHPRRRQNTADKAKARQRYIAYYEKAAATLEGLYVLAGHMEDQLKGEEASIDADCGLIDGALKPYMFLNTMKVISGECLEEIRKAIGDMVRREMVSRPRAPTPPTIVTTVSPTTTTTSHLPPRTVTTTTMAGSGGGLARQCVDNSNSGYGSFSGHSPADVATNTGGVSYKEYTESETKSAGNLFNPMMSPTNSPPAAFQNDSLLQANNMRTPQSASTPRVAARNESMPHNNSGFAKETSILAAPIALPSAVDRYCSSSLFGIRQRHMIANPFLPLEVHGRPIFPRPKWLRPTEVVAAAGGVFVSEKKKKARVRRVFHPVPGKGLCCRPLLRKSLKNAQARSGIATSQAVSFTTAAPPTMTFSAHQFTTTTPTITTTTAATMVFSAHQLITTPSQRTTAASFNRSPFALLNGPQNFFADVGTFASAFENNGNAAALQFSGLHNGPLTLDMSQQSGDVTWSEKSPTQRPKSNDSSSKQMTNGNAAALQFNGLGNGPLSLEISQQSQDDVTWTENSPTQRPQSNHSPPKQMAKGDLLALLQILNVDCNIRFGRLFTPQQIKDALFLFKSEQNQQGVSLKDLVLEDVKRGVAELIASLLGKVSPVRLNGASSGRASATGSSVISGLEHLF